MQAFGADLLAVTVSVALLADGDHDWLLGYAVGSWILLITRGRDGARLRTSPTHSAGGRQRVRNRRKRAGWPTRPLVIADENTCSILVFCFEVAVSVRA